MDEVLRYRGRSVTAAEVAQIRELIARHPGHSRRALSKELCAAWGWVQENGSPRDMVCRGLMLALHRAGQIELPPVRQVPPNPLARRARPRAIEVEQEPIEARLGDLGPLAIAQVRRTSAEALFNSLIEAHHYLGYTQPVGEHLKFLVRSGERPIACMAWSSAPRHLGPRDRYLGWSAAARRQNLRYLTYQSRYLILPWVNVRYLASHLLSRTTRILSKEWERVYGHPVYFAETFVDTTRFAGTCYRAANWVFMGRTTGRGNNDLTHRANRPRKDVLGYALTKRYRELLTSMK